MNRKGPKHRGSDAKPRLSDRRSKAPRSKLEAAAKRAKIERAMVEPGSPMSFSDRSANGRITGKVFATFAGKGGVGVDPTTVVASRIRSALRRPPIPDITIYDAEGKVLRVLDGLTRKEKPLE